jgi:mono/diheme cytochrome c family protein
MRSRIVWIVCIGLALGSACGDDQAADLPASLPGVQPDQPTKDDDAPIRTVEPGEPPEPPSPTGKIPDPPAAAPAAPAASAKPDAARGAALYATNCSSCHGPGGDGDGPAAAALQPKPARHADGAYMNALSNEHLFKVIKEGGAAVGKSPLMAPWGGTLDDTQIWDLVAFVRSLAKPRYPGSVP